MEWEILQIMKQAEGTRFTYKDIGKIVDRKEYRENPHWARPLLEKMLYERLIWKDEGYYLCPTEEHKACPRLTPEPLSSPDIPIHRLPP